MQLITQLVLLLMALQICLLVSKLQTHLQAIVVFEGGGVVAIIVLVTSPLITLDEDSSIGKPFIVKFVTNLATLPRNVTSALMLSMPIRL